MTSPGLLFLSFMFSIIISCEIHETKIACVLIYKATKKEKILNPSPLYTGRFPEGYVGQPDEKEAGLVLGLQRGKKTWSPDRGPGVSLRWTRRDLCQPGTYKGQGAIVTLI